MPANKNAVIRYLIIDDCLSRREHTIKDLHVACLNRLGDVVSERTIPEDIAFMQCEPPLGFGAPIIRKKVGRTYVYSYSDNNYSIRGKKLNLREIENIQTTLAVLSRFNGIPGTEWMENTMSKLEAITGIESDNNNYISIQSNPTNDWLKNFRELMKIIPEKIALEVYYKSFKDTEPKKYLFSPYYLKEYNTRWFVIGQCPEYKNLTIFAIDRISTMRTLKGGYISNEDDKGEKRYNFDEYFDDVIGVSVRTEDPVEKVLLKIRNDSWPYIETKPLHGSQKRWRDGDDEHFTGIQLEVQINYELKANLLYRGSAIKVLAPESLVEWMKQETQKMREYYI